MSLHNSNQPGSGEKQSGNYAIAMATVLAALIPIFLVVSKNPGAPSPSPPRHSVPDGNRMRSGITTEPGANQTQWQPEFDWGPLQSTEYRVIDWQVTKVGNSTFSGTRIVPKLQIRVEATGGGIDAMADAGTMAEQLQQSWFLLVSLRDANDNEVAPSQRAETMGFLRGQRKDFVFDLPENYTSTVRKVVFGGLRATGGGTFNR